MDIKEHFRRTRAAAEQEKEEAAARMSHFLQQEQKKEGKRGCRTAGLVFVELMMPCLHDGKVNSLKVETWGFSELRGDFSALIRGLLELINRQSSFDQRMERRTGEEGGAERWKKPRKRAHLEQLSIKTRESNRFT